LNCLRFFHFRANPSPFRLHKPVTTLDGDVRKNLRFKISLRKRIQEPKTSRKATSKASAS
jgi:hypothetical protein